MRQMAKLYKMASMLKFWIGRAGWNDQLSCDCGEQVQTMEALAKLCSRITYCLKCFRTCDILVMPSVVDIHAEPKDDLCANNKDLCHSICD